MRTIRSLTLFIFAIATASGACNCITKFSVCDEVRMSDVVFIGTVESLTNAKTLFESAKTQEDLAALFKSYTLTQSSATLRIKTIFRRPSDFPDDDDPPPAAGSASKSADKNKDKKDKDDDDDRKDGGQAKPGQQTPAVQEKPRDPNDDLKEGDAVVINTDPGACGFDFHKGDTYLVYASEDEQDTRLQTTACTRTARVSDAGEDLAYLYFLKNDESRSARLEGFATSDAMRLLLDRFQYTGRIDSPVPGIRIELKSDHDAFNTTSDQNGRFVFDGLAEDSYTLFAYPPDEIGHPKPLASPRTLRIESRSCTSNVLLIPKTPAKTP
jgi:hypothetical protein